MDFLVEVRRRNVLGGREVMVHPDLRPLNLPTEDPTHLLDHDPHHPLETLHQTCLEATLVATDLLHLNLLEPQDPHQDLKPQILTLTDPPLPHPYPITPTPMDHPSLLQYPKLLTKTPMDPPLPLLYPKLLRIQTPMDPLKQALLVLPTLPNLNLHLRLQEPQPLDPQTNLDLHRSFT